MNIKVTYSGPLDTALDAAIESAMESAGFTWYASGYSFETYERDLVFDSPEIV